MGIDNFSSGYGRAAGFRSADRSVSARPLSRSLFIRAVAIIGSALALSSAQMAEPGAIFHQSHAVPARSASVAAVKNTWRGITPLQSSAADAARAVGLDSDLAEAPVSGPFKVEGGEVTPR